MKVIEALQDTNAIAVFKQRRTGKHTAIMQTRFGMFEYRLDYDGMFAWGATADLTDYIMRLIQDESMKGNIEWLKTPQTNYHVWHICYCEECNGKVWTHSQEDWNSHLKRIDNDKIFTFPS